jgi:REP element-mobilizing transposase RayT
MTYARKALVSLNDTAYYHVVARCVRRAWLWGYDKYAGRDFSHRKAWVLERLTLLASMFAIDVCAYAVLSNHYHLVLHVDRDRGRAWSLQEVVTQWCKLFVAPPSVERWLSGEADEAERVVAEAIIESWRERLYDISWFMRCLNEHIARRANLEDNCKGRFWEGRFQSQALLDEAGLLTAMAYVDLNPIRAGIAGTPEESDFTSIYARIRELQAQPGAADAERSEMRVPLLAFRSPQDPSRKGIPFDVRSYLALVDWTGRRIVEGRRGSIDEDLPPILGRLGIEVTAWEHIMQPHGNVFGRALGRVVQLRQHARTLHQRWIRGLGWSRRLYGMSGGSE